MTKKLIAFILFITIAYPQSASYSPQVKITTANTAAVDAFGRLRVSTPTNIFDTQNEYSASGLFWEDNLINGCDTNFYFNGQPVIDLITTTTAGCRGIRQTHEYFRYESGVSQLVVLTVRPSVGKSGMRKLWGYGDSLNGIFFGMDSDSLFVMKRSNATGSIVDSVVYQANWNGDKLNGTGSSGFNLKTYASNAFAIDFAWLGVQRVRMMVMNENGDYIVAHSWYNGNANTGVYMRTANLPIREEIRHRSGTSQVDTLRAICATLKREGGSIDLDAYRQIAMPYDYKSLNGTFKPIISIRPKTTFNGNINRAQIKDLIAVITATGQTVIWKLVYNPTLTGASWRSQPQYGGVDISIAEYDTSATAYTGGIDIAADEVVAGGTGSGAFATSNATSILSKLPLYIDLLGATSTPITLVARGVASGATIHAIMKWKEIR